MRSNVRQRDKHPIAMKSHSMPPLLLILAAAIISYHKIRDTAGGHKSESQQTDRQHPWSTGFGKVASNSVHRTTKRARQTATTVKGSDENVDLSDMDPIRKERLLKRMSDWNAIE